MENILSSVKWWDSDWELDEKYDDAYFAGHCIIMVPASGYIDISHVFLVEYRFLEEDQLIVDGWVGDSSATNIAMFELIGVDNTLLGNVQSVKLYAVPLIPPTM